MWKEKESLMQKEEKSFKRSKIKVYEKLISYTFIKLFLLIA